MNRFAVALATLALASSCALAEDATPKPTEAEAKSKVEALTKAIAAKDDTAKKEAISACADCRHTLCAAALAQLLVGDTEEMRIFTAAALGKMKTFADGAKALHNGLKPNEKNEKVLDAIFKAMGEVAHASSVPVCKDWAMSRFGQRDTADQPSVNAAINCLGELKFKASVTALIDMMHRNEVTNGRAGGKGLRMKSEGRCGRALSKLTGENFDFSNDWDDWWKKNAALFNDDLTKK